MKKFALCLIACLAIAPFAHSAVAPLGESLNEYQAITTALGTNPSFQNVINSSEFIVDIKRLSKKINKLGEVRYGIVTRLPANFVQQAMIRSCNSCSGHSHHHSVTHRYIVVLNVAANPGIGPNIVTVVSITPVD